MSDSDLSSEPSRPSDAKIEAQIRKTVRAALAAEEDITINSVRASVEEGLKLEEGFFRDDATWKKRSKEIINAIVKASHEEGEQAEEKAGVEVASPPPAVAAKKGTKRKSTASEPVKKSNKKAKKEESPIGGDESEVEEKAPVSNGRAKKNGTKSAPSKARPISKSEPESELSDPPASAGNENGDASEPPADDKSSRTAAEDDESDFSSVVDEPPPKKKRSKKDPSASGSSTTKTKAATKSKPSKTDSTKPSTTTASSPDEEEIKRLQSWLLKCGVRKLWHRELASCETAKEKIRHLQTMLADVGMTGRFSAEKARGIKESRELAAELEAAREFNEQWGDGNGEDGEDGSGVSESKPEVDEEKTGGGNAVKRRGGKPRGLVVFSDDDDDDSD